MKEIIIGLLIGIFVGFGIIEFLVPRFPVWGRILLRMDTNCRAIEMTYYKAFDVATRMMRDRGWYKAKYAKFGLTVPMLIEARINKGTVLEIGPGPGYLGLEWLNSTVNTRLIAIDRSRDMLEIAMNNAKGYRRKPEYLFGDAANLSYLMDRGNFRLSYPSHFFDGVFSSASLHEWDDPVQVFREIKRVLKPGAPFVVADLRRDTSLLIKAIVKLAAWPGPIRRDFSTSFDRAYTVMEVALMLNKAGITDFDVEKSLYSLIIRGKKVPEYAAI